MQLNISYQHIHTSASWLWNHKHKDSQSCRSVFRTINALSRLDFRLILVPVIVGNWCVGSTGFERKWFSGSYLPKCWRSPPINMSGIRSGLYIVFDMYWSSLNSTMHIIKVWVSEIVFSSVSIQWNGTDVSIEQTKPLVFIIKKIIWVW